MQHMKFKKDILVSFNLTKRLKDVRSEWEQALADSGERVLGTAITTQNADHGGKLVHFTYNDESDSFSISKEIEIPQPNGFIQELTGILVASMQTNSLHVFSENFQFVSEIVSNVFNDLHSLAKSRNGYLVTSTGVDAIFEVSDTGEILWEFWFTDFQDYSNTPLGSKRKLSKSEDHRSKEYATVYQTTHVNSAIMVKDDENSERYLLATLFHQGQLVRVDRTTNEIVIILDGLNCPHAIRQYDNYFTLCDSRNNRVLILNKDFSIHKEVKGDYNWVQDAFLVEDENLLVLADSNNNRIIFHDLSTSSEEIVKYDEGWRIFQIEEWKY